MIAHLGGLPVEELLPAVIGSGGVLFVRGWIMLHVRDRSGDEGGRA